MLKKLLARHAMLDKPSKLGAGTSASSTSLLTESIGALQALGAPHEPRTLTYGLWRAFGREFLGSALLPTLGALGYQLLILTILRYAARVVEFRDGWPIQTGFESASTLAALGGAGVLFISLAQARCARRAAENLSLAGVRAHVALSGLLYRKLLRLAPPPAERALDALLRSLDGVDEVALPALLQLLAAPLQLLAGLAVLASEVGALALAAGVALGALAHGALQLLAAATFHSEQQLQSARADRLALLDQLLPRTESDVAPHATSITTAGWPGGGAAEGAPHSLLVRLEDARRAELTEADSLRRTRAVLAAVHEAAPAAAAAAMLGARALSTGRATRLPSAAIVLLLAHWLRGPALALPAALHAVRDAAAAVAAAHAFLALPDRAVVGIGALRAVGVAIDGADFGGPSSAAVLRGVDVRASAGQLVGVAGTDADGAPLVVQALCGGLPLKSGSLALRGRVALVPRAPLIVPGSLRANVEFGLPHDPQRFERAVSSCGLLTADDLAALPAGDLTPVRAAGASTPDGADDALELSQAQALRVALARAVYAQADVVLVDDPLAAMPAAEAAEAASVLEEVLGERGALGGALRVVATARPEQLKGASAVLVLRRGEVVASGTYEKLEADRGGYWAHLVAAAANATAAAAEAAPPPLPPPPPPSPPPEATIAPFTLPAASGPLQPSSPSTLPPTTLPPMPSTMPPPVAVPAQQPSFYWSPPPSCAPRGSPSSAARARTRRRSPRSSPPRRRSSAPGGTCCAAACAGPASFRRSSSPPARRAPPPPPAARARSVARRGGGREAP